MLCELCNQYKNTNSDSAILFGRQGLKLAEKANTVHYIVQCRFNIGTVYFEKDNFTEAISYFRSTVEAAKGVEMSGLKANALNNLGLCLAYQGNYPDALKALFQSLAIKEQLNDPLNLATTFKGLGMVYYELKDYTTAIKYFKSSLGIFETAGKLKQQASALNNIGSIYYKQKDYPNAIHYFNQCRQISEVNGFKELLATTLANLGSVYTALKDYTPAIDFFQQSLKICEEIGDLYGNAATESFIGVSYFEQGNFAQARRHSTQALDHAKRYGFKDLLFNSYQTASKIDSALGDYTSALKHYKLAVLYKDSLYNEEKTKEIGKLEGKYEIEKAQDAEKRKQEEEAKEIKRQNNLQYLLIFAGVAVFFLGLFFIRRLKLPLILSEGLIFLAFLMLFEYILIVTEPFLEQYTGGVPIQKLGLNIVLAAIFTPLHKFLEGKLKKQIIKTKTH